MDACKFGSHQLLIEIYSFFEVWIFRIGSIMICLQLACLDVYKRPIQFLDLIMNHFSTTSKIGGCSVSDFTFFSSMMGPYRQERGWILNSPLKNPPRWNKQNPEN